MSHKLDRIWYGNSLLFWLLLPLTGVFLLSTALRRALYANGVLKSRHPGVPVIIVGNINIGGTGKTPVVIELCRRLQRMGQKPGVASRGYARKGKGLLELQPDTDAATGGDEPVLVKRRTQCPVVVSGNRLEAANRLIEIGCTVIVCDDGLQHYALKRDAEVVVVDGHRGLGNGICLPAGPLREPGTRLASVDLILINGDGWDYPNAQHFSLMPGDLVSLADQGRKPLSELTGRPVHAVAGIGNPVRFFDLLRDNGLEVMEHSLPDHAALTPERVSFSDGLPVIMTEKDAVKWQREWTGGDNMWYLPVDVALSESAAAPVESLLERLVVQP
jgi:tetraacyldisaccharide 4'-kinase